MKFLFALVFVAFFCEAKFIDVLIEKNGVKTKKECFGYIAYEFEKNGGNGEFFVRDFESGKYLEPVSAFFVLGSNLKSACSKYSVVAFSDESRANKFIAKFGGDIRDFDFALFVAKKDLESDAKIIEYRNENSAKRGREIYDKFCKKNLKNCNNLSNTNRQDLEYFLQNQHLAKQSAKIVQIDVPQDSKCPVCGMFVSKYPKWAAQIVVDANHSHFFDGVKDMMKFYFQPSKFHHNHSQSQFTNIFVTDYFSLEKIDAKKSFFVIGSNIYGPMGNELIPFKNEADAQEFSKFHSGKAILKFNNITEKIVLGLDK